MGFDKHLEAKGIALSEDNSLPQGQRTQKVVKRVIAAVRAAESEFNDELRDANERCRKAQAQVIELTAKLHEAETLIRKYRVAEKLEGIESLTIADRKSLLLTAQS